MRKFRTLTVLMLSLFMAFSSFVSFSAPVFADSRGQMTPKRKYLESRKKSLKSDDDEGASGVHADPNTFRKNFILTPAQKIYTITESEKVVSEIIKPEMSDLEKYYTLACWVNKHVEYDWNFWCGDYNFEYYSHQWDSYGGMNPDEKSVCVGIAIFYATMCHAADLPCRFARLDPDYLDHTINYIPDINGNAYLVDVTENCFLMSEKGAGSFGEYLDKEYAKITKDCTDTTFEYTDSEGDLAGSGLKDEDGNYASYNEWFTEYALHKNTKKKFKTPYVEKGSGEAGKKYATYKDFPANFTDSPDIWFLDDYYEDPAAVTAKVQNREFDKQLLDISGLKKNYQADNAEQLAEVIENDINVRYFPTEENGKIVAKAADLTKDTDYTVTYDSYDDKTNTAVFLLKGNGDYKGSQELRVKVNSAVVLKAPVAKENLVYDGKPHELIEPGEAENGQMQYALGSKEEPTGEFKAEIPTATKGGKYYVWYKAAGDETHVDSEAELMKGRAIIARKQLKVIIKNRKLSVKVGGTVKLSPKISEKIPAEYYFVSIDEDIATIGDDGTIKGKKEGIAHMYVGANFKYSTANYEEPDSVLVVVNVGRPANPMKLKAKTVKLKYKALKKKAKTVKRAKAFTVSKAQGTLAFKLVSAKKGSKSFKKKFKINAKTGNVTVKKGLKKGTYKVKVKVKAKGNAKYKPSAWKKVTFKVKVK